MSQSNPLVIYGTKTLDGSGNGTVKIGPNTHQRWELNTAAIVTSTAILIPQFRLYIGPAIAQEWFVDGTFVGSLNSTDNVNGHEVKAGEYVWGVWTGGDSGATATLTLRGNIITGVGQ